MISYLQEAGSPCRVSTSNLALCSIMHNKWATPHCLLCGNNNCFLSSSCVDLMDLLMGSPAESPSPLINRVSYIFTQINNKLTLLLGTSPQIPINYHKSTIKHVSNILVGDFTLLPFVVYLIFQWSILFLFICFRYYDDNRDQMNHIRHTRFNDFSREFRNKLRDIFPPRNDYSPWHNVQPLPPPPTQRHTHSHPHPHSPTQTYTHSHPHNPMMPHTHTHSHSHLPLNPHTDRTHQEVGYNARSLSFPYDGDYSKKQGRFRVVIGGHSKHGHNKTYDMSGGRCSYGYRFIGMLTWELLI